MNGDLPTLASRTLGRTGRPIPPILWRIGPHTAAPADVLQRLPETGATWFFIDAGTPDQTLAQLSPGASIVIGMDVGQLTPRAAAWLSRRLQQLSLATCEGVLIQDASPSAIKSGGPFHRLIQLRERGLTRTFWLDAEDAATAEWMVENTPAHAVCVPFSLDDQLAAYRVLPAAAEMGLAVIAKPGDLSAANLSFIAAEPRISAIVIGLPQTPQDLRRMAVAVAHPMPDEQRLTAWEAWQAAHPEPPRPKRNLPPDMA